MKILITSDNHLGFKERVPLLSDDSYDTFEEILIHANLLEVDLIIQSGDLFHDNRPSRHDLNQTIALLKKYLTGKRSIDFTANKKLNYDDPNLNISIPLISIHGNHDDPSGIFSTSPMHILKSTNLVNYIGNSDSIEEINVEPIIFCQNNQKIAVYSLGHIKDRRLYKLFLERKVHFHKSEEKCFNILMVHQNRFEYTKKDYLPHEFLPNWFDLVIYGHEHESVVLKLSNFVLLQVGSTVRTSLKEKETYDKFFYILDTKEGTLERKELKTVRKFVMDKLESIDYEEEIENKIERMIQLTENDKKTFSEEDAFKNVFYQKLFLIEEETEKLEVKKIKNGSFEKIELQNKLKELENKKRNPLLRLKVILKNNYSFNKNKIQLKYKDIIANYNEILLIKKINNDIKKEIIQEKEEMSFLLKENLNFIALSEDGFINALDNFVKKDDKNAFSIFIKGSIEKIVDLMVKRNYDDFLRRLKELKNELELKERLDK